MQRRTGRQRPERPGPTAKGSGATGHAARARTDAGFSLTESLAAILLVTTVILGLAAGILTTVRATRTVSQTQRNEAMLTDATEAIKAQPFVPCATPTSYALPAMPSVSVLAVTHLLNDGTGTEFTATCPPATEDLAQRITVRAGTRRAEVVKRNPAPSGVTP